MDADYKMYILVNTDLKMGVGKKCSQVGHAVQAVTERLLLTDKALLKKYKRGQTKIVLKATEKQMRQLIDEFPKCVQYVLDAGHTQVEPGSLTAMAFFPILDNNKPDLLKELKLL